VASLQTPGVTTTTTGQPVTHYHTAAY